MGEFSAHRKNKGVSAQQKGFKAHSEINMSEKTDELKSLDESKCAKVSDKVSKSEDDSCCNDVIGASSSWSSIVKQDDGLQPNYGLADENKHTRKASHETPKEKMNIADLESSKEKEVRYDNFELKILEETSFFYWKRGDEDWLITDWRLTG